MSEMEWFEKIEDYLKHRLPEAEHQAFEAEIAANPKLEKEVAMHRDMMLAVDDHERELAQKPPSKDLLDLRDLMENVYEQLQEENPDKQEEPTEVSLPKTGRWIRPALIVLALVAALLASLRWWAQTQPETSKVEETPIKKDSLVPIATAPDTTKDNITPLPKPAPSREYAAVVRDVYAESPYAPGVLMGDDTDDPAGNPLPKAGEAYGKLDFKEVVRLLETLPKAGRTDALKLRAHAQFQLKRYDLAARDFEELTKSPPNRVDAEWNLLLCYAAQLPKTKLAYESWLAKVSANGPKYEQKVANLKKRLAAGK